MGRRSNFGRPVHGVLILDKPAGLSSNQALQRARRLFFANKAGHTGSLDPLATGVLPLCFGEATKFSQFLLDADKGYRTTFVLGQSTSTADAEGDVVEQTDASAITEHQVVAALQAFRGEILQVPPMVSALKHRGKPLYQWAREGVDVERRARAVRIDKLAIQGFRPGSLAEVDVELECSKGTYVRSIASELGAALGVGAHVQRLHRHLCGRFGDRHSHTLTKLEHNRGEQPAESLDHCLEPVDALIDHFPQLVLDDNSGHYFCRGQAVMDLKVYRLGNQGDTVRVCQENGRFLGLGEITDDGCVAPRRVVALA